MLDQKVNGLGLELLYCLQKRTCRCSMKINKTVKLDPCEIWTSKNDYEATF